MQNTNEKLNLKIECYFYNARALDVSFWQLSDGKCGAVRTALVFSSPWISVVWNRVLGVVGVEVTHWNHPPNYFDPPFHSVLGKTGISYFWLVAHRSVIGLGQTVLISYLLWLLSGRFKSKYTISKFRTTLNLF